MFLCLQEPTGMFGPRFQQIINMLMADFNNVIVTCSKSGKLMTPTLVFILIKCVVSFHTERKILVDNRFLEQPNKSTFI